MRIGVATEYLRRDEGFDANRRPPAAVVAEDGFAKREAHAHLVLARPQVVVPRADGRSVAVLAEVEPGVQIAWHDHRIGAPAVGVIGCAADSISVVLGETGW
jgi:hypothetical protein